MLRLSNRLDRLEKALKRLWVLFSCDIVEGGFEKSNFDCNAYKLWGMSFREIMEGSR